MTIRDLVTGIVQEFHLENYQVRELPGKTLADLNAKASSVENSEIAIEDVERRMSNFELDNIHAIKDPRLRCVKELLYEEEQFFNDLKCVFEVYAEPLKKWGMTRADYKAIFEPLETICNLNVRLSNMLEEAVKKWETSTTLIGGIFTELDILWSTYDDYFQFFRGTRMYLKQKRDYEPEFQAFINLQRGARNTHLEMLLLRPIQHVVDYERILTSLLDKTPADHPDRQDLDHVATNFRRIVRERSEEIVAFENEVT
ncbi:rho guanine nucleotide exchange factor 38-like [Actinia tenebrosa]|uniref:Rho guanine nucleotide exchange factor 38-like n=1 Tax=Actinia tenebrosa TaxID=6105 RepID=A0A6P8HKU9_ACTTE|nr:rho guanine nucleotide exchange factor 38-like [Actinia tenebrosa]